MGLTAQERKERRAKAVGLLLAGATYQAIADECGYAHRGNAHRDVQSGLKEILDEADHSAGEKRRILLARLERLTLAAWPQAMEGDPGSIRAISRLIGQQMTLYGLQDPKRLEVQVTQNHDAEIERLLGYMLESERVRLETERAALETERARIAGAPRPRRKPAARP